jgi:lipoate-protein ligase A
VGRSQLCALLLSSDQRALHHGTMLIDVDFSALGKILNPDKAKLKVR